MRRLLLFIFTIAFSLNVISQDTEHARAPYPNEITFSELNVKMANMTTIRFTLRMGEAVDWCKLGLLISTDGGKSFHNISGQSRKLSGDIGKITSSGEKVINYDITEDKEYLRGKNVVFKVEVLSKHVFRREFVVAGVATAYPGLYSYGAMLGSVKKAGVYGKFKSNFNNSISAERTIEVGNNNGFWSNGVEDRKRMMATGGLMFHMTKWLIPYIGGGYAVKEVYLQDINKEWAMVSDLSYSGPALEAGFLIKAGHIVLSAAVNNICFKSTEGEVGIGFIF